MLDRRDAPSPAAPGVGAAGLCGTNRVGPGVDVESERDSVSPEPCCFDAPSRQSGGCWKSLVRGPAVLTSSAIPTFELQTSHRIPERRFWVLHPSSVVFYTPWVVRGLEGGCWGDLGWAGRRSLGQEPCFGVRRGFPVRRWDQSVLRGDVQQVAFRLQLSPSCFMLQATAIPFGAAGR